MDRRIFLLSTVLWVAAGLSACSGPSVSKPKDGIISLGPNITETLYAVGLGNRVIGVTDFCDYPPEAANVAKVGGYFNPNYERIALLNPATIILQGNPPEIATLAQQNGIHLVSCNMDSLATIDSGIELIGKELACVDAATDLRKQITTELDAVRASVAGKPIRKVLIINVRQDHSLNTLFTIGKPSFLSELLTVAGGENIFADESSNYFEASKETVVLRNPDVIIEFHAGEPLTDADKQQYLADWDALPTVNAVKNKEVHLFMDSYGLRPGPRVPSIAKRFAELIHPESSTAQP